MNISKHMEAIFVVATVALGAAAYASAALPSRPAIAAAALAPIAAVQRPDAAAPMYVVVISAKRLTPAEKAALDN
jgi:hypothetical protein